MLQPDSQLYTPCTRISVIQGLPDGVLSGPHECDLNLNNGTTVHIRQMVYRSIEITSTTPIPCIKIFDTFQDIETLLMLLDGRFYHIEKMEFESNCKEDTFKFPEITEELLDSRLNFFESRDFCQNGFLKLLQFPDVLTESLFSKWVQLRSELDIAFSMFLYALSDNKMPVDTNFAFLVELAEPFVELLKENSGFYQKLSPGKKDTSLQKCISAIINDFGQDIFSKEISGSYDGFLSTAIHSRNRIMHIKKKQSYYFSGIDCARYSLKFSLLYRKILLDLLGIPYKFYAARIQCAAKATDDYFNSVLTLTNKE